jgi:hypothetical protein
MPLLLVLSSSILCTLWGQLRTSRLLRQERTRQNIIRRIEESQ